MRIATIVLLYGFAIAFVWMGVHTAPQTGWPRTDVELNGCAALVLGMILKTAGHWTMMGLSRRVPSLHA